MIFVNKKKYKSPEIYLDEIFLDSKNIPKFDTYQLEGRLEIPISKSSFAFLSIFFGLVLFILTGKIFYLQAIGGSEFAERAEKNSFKQEILFPARGNILDRNGIKLAWGEEGRRRYLLEQGLAHLLGYVGKPSQEDLKNSSVVTSEMIIGKNGIEKEYEEFLRGHAGMKLVERDSKGEIISESVQDLPQPSDDLILSIDSRIQSQMFKAIQSTAQDRGFHGGAGVILDVKTGEVISLASWPEYNSQIMSDGQPAEEIQNFFQDANKPFMNRAISGLYTPGSVLKPIVALAALTEKIITPEKQIFSAGYISIPNPYSPGKPTIFKDWKAHGWVDMKRAITVSSDVYFYAIGGGYEDQKGLGIFKIREYAKKFGIDSKTGIDLAGEKQGIIPSPELKVQKNPNDPDWRIGDSYNASIGQGDFNVTPIEMAVYAAALATDGKVVRPHFMANDANDRVAGEIGIPKENFQIVKEGMRACVTEGTAMSLSIPEVKIAGKTGTAELGAAKKYVNSWVIGFFPYENPKYAFAVVMEKGPVANLVGSPYVMRQVLDWMRFNAPEYF